MKLLIARLTNFLSVCLAFAGVAISCGHGLGAPQLTGSCPGDRSILLLAPQTLPQGGVKLRLRNADGSAPDASSLPVLDILATTDLALPFRDWTPVPSGALRAAGGVMELEDTASGQFERRFYALAEGGRITFDAACESSFGSQGTNGGQFTRMLGMGLGVNNELHVVDDVNNRVQVFDKDTFAFKRSYAGDGIQPIDVAVDATGRTYVCRYGGSVSVYAPDGVLLRSFFTQVSNVVEYSNGVTVDPFTGNLIVANDSRITIWTPEGSLIRAWAVASPRLSLDVWASSAGEIWSAEWDRVARYSSEGVLLSSFTPDGSAATISGDNQGVIYVSYLHERRVDAYSTAGRPLGRYTAPPVGNSTGPLDGFTYGLACGGSNQLFVGDRAKYRVRRLCAQKEPGRIGFATPCLAGFGSHGTNGGQFERMNGLSLGISNELHVVDDENNRVQVFDRNTFAFRREYGGEDIQPIDVTVDASGRAFVSRFGGRVSVYSPDGGLVRSFSTRLSNLVSYSVGVAIDPTSGNLVVANTPTGDSFISVWTPEGSLVRFWTLPAPHGVWDVWVSATGEIWAAEWDQIARYSSQGALLGSFPSSYAAQAICGDNQGVIYVAEGYDRRVDAYSVTGRYLGRYTAPPVGNPAGPLDGFSYGLAAMDGQIFIGDRANYRVIRLPVERFE